MHSVRFGLPVVLTEHARKRMVARDISETLVLLCLATVIDNGVVVKTVMHRWELST